MLKSRNLPAGAVLDGQDLDLDAFKKLEKMPTRLELIATIAGLIKQVTGLRLTLFIACASNKHAEPLCINFMIARLDFFASMLQSAA